MYPALLGLRKLITLPFMLALMPGKLHHGFSSPRCHSSTPMVVKKELGERQVNSRLLFWFGFGCRSGATVQSCLSRLPGFQAPQNSWTLALHCLLGLRSCQCALTPISPLLQHLSLLRHSICSQCSLQAKWKEAFPLLT